MKIRKQAIFLVKYDKLWLGGLYYKKHLISSLKLIGSELNIVIYTELKNIDLVKELLDDNTIIFRAYDPPIAKGFWSIELFCRKYFNKSLIGVFDKYLINGCFIFDFDDVGILRAKRKSKRIYWIPDLQDIFLPNNFSKDELDKRNAKYNFISANAKKVVFSSFDSLEAFKKQFSKVIRSRLDCYTLRFTVSHPVLNIENWSLLKTPNGLVDLNNKRYFIVSNQFMKHKNHEIVVNALSVIVEKNNDVLVLFTGKTEDPRFPNYFNSVVELIIKLNLSDNIMITGVIDRVQQLQLLKNSLAVIQPSFFEGWNSTVEDVKLLNANLIVSNIDIHKEQLVDYPALFFNPNDCKELSLVLSDILNSKHVFGKINYNYKKLQLKFGEDLEQLFLSE